MTAKTRSSDDYDDYSLRSTTTKLPRSEIGRFDTSVAGGGFNILMFGSLREVRCFRDWGFDGREDGVGQEMCMWEFCASWIGRGWGDERWEGGSYVSKGMVQCGLRRKIGPGLRDGYERSLGLRGGGFILDEDTLVL